MANSKALKRMTPKAAARIQSREAKKNGGKVKSGGFASRAQRAADRNQKTSEK